MSQSPAKPPRGFYLLPNAFTTGNLFAGVFAIMLAMQGAYETAAASVFLAMILDGMDGRVARLTNTQSVFGEQYDSMADMVSFGVAPALVMHAYALHEMGRLGLIASFIYIACAALRLARFNANLTIVDSRFFQGLPSPSAAALVAGFVWLSAENRLPIQESPWVALALVVYAGFSMVSTLPYISGKAFRPDSPRKPRAWWLIALVLVFAVVALDPPIMLFALFVLYSLSGWVLWVRRVRRAKAIFHPKEE